MNKLVKLFVLLTFEFIFVSCYAHTAIETNALVKAILTHAMLFDSDVPDENEEIDVTDSPYTLEGFLVGGQDGWTLEERKNVFGNYLQGLGVKNCRALSEMGKEEIRIAVESCRILKYTNSVPALTALALNTNGVFCDIAAMFVIECTPLNADTTHMVEFILTNNVAYSQLERSSTCGAYLQKVQEYSASSNSIPFAKDLAVEMFYRNREKCLVSNYAIDQLLCTNVYLYAMSSNRLVTARGVLSRADLDADERNKFISITNELQSSTQPLQWITVGGVP